MKSNYKLLSIIKSLGCLLLLLIPLFLVYKNLFLSGPLAWGDAPYFYPEALKELVKEPSGWIERGNNFGGPNVFLWISPLMVLYGVIGSLLNLGNDIAVRYIFYFPSVVLALVTPLFLTRYLKLSNKVQFFSSLIYSINTYFILLIDGGQVGVALAYGLFPLTFLFLIKWLDKPSFNSFSFALFFLFLCGIADPRVAVICLVAFIFWVFIDGFFKKESISGKIVLSIVSLVLAWLALCSYWIYPLIKNGFQDIGTGVSNLNFISLLDSLLLYQPHFPGNEFGKLFAPPFYFVFVPLLIFGGIFFKFKDKLYLRLLVLYLIFAFMAKGVNLPLGELYGFLAGKTLFGFAFRDSSKFFIPLVLFAGISIGLAIDKITTAFSSKWVSPIILLVCYLFFGFLVMPVLREKLNFVLSNREHSNDYRIISDNLRKDLGFFRTVWFPEKYPLSFETSDKPAIDARSLVNSRPFAVLNASEDAFNFLYKPNFAEWFRALGIKYVILSGNSRNVTPTEEDKKNWDLVTNLIGKTLVLEKQNWGINVPVYEVKDIRQKVFAVDKIIAVVGPEPVVSKNLPFASVYFEDGKLEPNLLGEYKPDSIKILLNGKSELDLSMSFLQKYFVSSTKSDWAKYDTNDYLKWKYQLLIRGIEYKDFDYGKGILFSTQTGEKAEFDLKTNKSGEYMLAVRFFGGPLKLDFSGNQFETETARKDNFSWYIKKVNLSKGDNKLIIENPGGIRVANVAALIPIVEWNKAQDLSKTYLTRFGTITENKISDNWKEAVFEKISPVRYIVMAPENAYWLIFTDSYHQGWKLRRGPLLHESLPIFSMVNGFYIEPNWANTEIVFKGNDMFRWGIWFSLVTILSLGIVYLWFRSDKK